MDIAMTDTSFIINRLDSGWVWQDIVDDDVATMYCQDELEIPEELINSLEYRNKSIVLSLYRERSYFRDDWYVNLQRIAS